MQHTHTVPHILTGPHMQHLSCCCINGNLSLRKYRQILKFKVLQRIALDLEHHALRVCNKNNIKIFITCVYLR